MSKYFFFRNISFCVERNFTKCCYILTHIILSQRGKTNIQLLDREIIAVGTFGCPCGWPLTVPGEEDVEQAVPYMSHVTSRHVIASQDSCSELTY